MTRRTLAFGVLAVGLAALFMRLGVWQVHRAEERRAANAEIRLALGQPPIRLVRDELAQRDAAGRLAYRRAGAAGYYDPDREVVVKGRSWEGSPGVELLTPLVLEGGGEVWVNRGWVPSPDAAIADARAYREPGRVRVRGFLRPETEAEAREGVEARLVLQQFPDPALPRYPIRRGEPELRAGPHLSYAVQWFAFAAIALVGYAAYAWSRGGGPGGRRSGIDPGDRAVMEPTGSDGRSLKG